jgi:hypothetical protein
MYLQRYSYVIGKSGKVMSKERIDATISGIRNI